MNVQQSLEELKQIHAHRNNLYRDNHKRAGAALRILLGNVELVNDRDFKRFGLLQQLFSKLSRYTTQFKDGGHPDSLDDMAIYAMMLKEIDAEWKNKTEIPIPAPRHASDDGKEKRWGAFYREPEPQPEPEPEPFIEEDKFL